MKKIIVGLVVLMTITFAIGNYIPEEGYVPNSVTAIKIAEAVWLPVYGEGIYTKTPFQAKLSKDGTTWVVQGSLPEGMKGGVPCIEIRKSDATILKMIHGK